jgi:hypothetical protein
MAPSRSGAAPALLTFFFDGRAVEARSGETIAAALLRVGTARFRQTRTRGESRGLYCGMGLCWDCAMVVDGRPDVRTCVEEVRPGMRVETQHGTGERPPSEPQRGGATDARS